MVQLISPRTTSRLHLRRFEGGDLDALAEIFGDDEINRYLYRETRSRDETREALRRLLDKPVATSEDNVLSVAVVERSGTALVGEFMLRWLDNEHFQGEIGGSLRRDVHGRGYATEVYRELLDIGFGTYRLHRIVGQCDGRNAPSVRSLEKAGLHQEAHLVENEFVKGEWTDEVIMAIRFDEWQATRTLEHDARFDITSST